MIAGLRTGKHAQMRAILGSMAVQSTESTIDTDCTGELAMGQMEQNIARLLSNLECSTLVENSHVRSADVPCLASATW